MAKKLVEVSILILVDENEDEQVIAESVHNTLEVDQYLYGMEVLETNVSGQGKNIHKLRAIDDE